ncbi:MAG TPA: TonB family protein [Opitutus sp.]|nr:TonB family protein [Opitutus sp.]
METRFILPVTIATALHALVWLVPREPAPPAIKAVNDDPVLPPFRITLDRPDEVVEVTVREPKPAKSAQDIRRPEADEPPARIVPDDRITEQVPPVVKVDFHPDRILPGVPGAIDGDENGGRAGVSVLDSRLLDNPPHTRSQVSPIYPSELKNLGVTGEVTVEFIVDEAGRVVNPRVVRSTNSGFEDATLRAVAHWRFEPGQKDGRPVRFRMAVPVEFSLGT